MEICLEPYLEYVMPDDMVYYRPKRSLYRPSVDDVLNLLSIREDAGPEDMVIKQIGGGLSARVLDGFNGLHVPIRLLFQTYTDCVTLTPEAVIHARGWELYITDSSPMVERINSQMAQAAFGGARLL